ncbi:leucine-rich repeat domain-containing protein [Flavobacterium sp. C3NV]|uniref:leucine-rich repeat domain-containing protein n=1 Tax=Flavobacterium sp. C3NV TaxID=3393358 RepID=UPI00398FD23D
MRTKLLLLLLLNSLLYAQTPNVPTYVSTNGLIAYYPFNGNTNDQSGNGINGTPTNLTSTTDRSGVINSAYSFNGTSSNIQANLFNFPQNTNSRTITGWFKAGSPVNSSENDFCIFNYGDTPTSGFKISLYRKGYLDLKFGSETFSTQENYFNNQWTFFALVFNGNNQTFSLYINNVLKLNGSASTFSSNFGIFRIGKNNSDNYFEGSIDDIGLWNRTLTVQEISSLYYSNTATPTITAAIFANNSTTVCGGQLVSLTSTISPTGSYTYKWMKNGVIIPGQTSAYYSAIESGDYTLEVKNQNNTTAISNKITAIVTETAPPTAVAQIFDNSATIADLKATGVDIKWYGSPVGLNPLLLSTPLKTGYYYASQTINGCESTTRITVGVTIINTPPEYTLIPDLNFENALISLGIDSGIPDGKVLTSNISTVKELNVNAKSISDLTGIQNFKSLTNLSCSSNKLTELDVTNNTALIFLSVGYNNITSLNVSKNGALTSLHFPYNQVTSIDVSNNPILGTLYFSRNFVTNLNLSKNSALTNLQCDYNLLKTIDVSKNTALIELVCEGNQITDLDISSNTLLKGLYFNLNQLTNLNVSKNTELTTLQCASNKLTSLDVSNNTALTLLYCDSNQLINLDVSKNTALKNIKCSSNQLTSLNLKNGNNANFGKINFINNPNLTCILVDNVNYSNENWNTAKDATATFNINCSQEYTLIPDPNFEERLIMLGIDKDGKNGKVLNTSISKIDHLYVGKYSIKDLTGISGFTSLRGLTVSENELTSLDLSKNTLLDTLDCSKNKLRTLNLKNGNNKNFYSNRSNFSDNPDLTCIQVDDVAYSNANWATIKDASATFDTNCPIEYVTLPDSNFEQKLIDLGIDTDGLNGKITITDVSFITSLDLSNTNIKDITGIENFTALTTLDLSNNQITTLDLSKNVLLETLNVSSNQITTLDLSKNVNLRIVYVVNNPLISLNLKNGNNKNFVLPVETGKKSASLYTSFLGLTTLGCIQVDDADYSNANWSKIKEANTTYSNTCKSLGIEDNTFDKVAIYPNPTKGEVNISNIKVEKATVYNSLGQLVRTFILDSSNSNNTINLSGLPKGVYYIYLINQDAASAKKIIVE